MKQAGIILNSGQSFTGFSPDWQKDDFYGEVVFTTGMTGYVETLTDPSYAGQIVVFTYPLIGNYAVPPKKFWESEKIHAAGVVVGEACEWPDTLDSRFRGNDIFGWLKEQGIPLLTSVDTRQLTKTLREKGVTPGVLACSGRKKFDFFDPNETDLVARVAVKKCREYPSPCPSPKRGGIKGGVKKIIAVDCGMKKNLLRSLLKFPVTVKIVPHDYDYSREKFDGVFLSNGPGDPEKCEKTVAVLRAAMKKQKPIFGVCLGNQIMALAASAKTYKLPFGHRGHNQPCQETTSGRCFVTSQNHGFCVDAKTLPSDWQVSFRNLNDGSVEGIAHKHLPFFAVQFHPEAAPGPTDTAWLFEKFYSLL